jgi:hypothetical protein
LLTHFAERAAEKVKVATGLDKGDLKDKTKEVAGKAKGKTYEVAGKARESVEEMKGI